MARKLLSELTDAELEEARRLWGELVAKTMRNVSEIPSPSWTSVIDRLEEGARDYDAEVARRSQTHLSTP